MRRAPGTQGDDHSRTPESVCRSSRRKPPRPRPAAGDDLRDHHRAPTQPGHVQKPRQGKRCRHRPSAAPRPKRPRFMSVTGGAKNSDSTRSARPRSGGEAAGAQGQRPAREGQHTGNQALSRALLSEVRHHIRAGRARARRAGRPQTPRPRRPRRPRPRTDRLSPAPRTTRPLRFRFPKYDTNARQCI